MWSRRVLGRAVRQGALRRLSTEPMKPRELRHARPGYTRTFSKKNQFHIVLLQDMPERGWARGDVVAATAGFSRNFLIPNGYAVYATEENVEKYAVKKDDDEAAADRDPQRRTDYKELCRILARKPLFFQRRADDGYTCYNPTSKEEVIRAFEKQMRLKMDPEDLRMPAPEDAEDAEDAEDGAGGDFSAPIRTIGEHVVHVNVSLEGAEAEWVPAKVLVHRRGESIPGSKRSQNRAEAARLAAMAS